MRNVLIAATAFSGLASALPQMINIGAAEAVPVPDVLGPKTEELPNTDNYNESAAAQTVANSVASTGVTTKRSVTDACAQQPGGAATNPGTGTVDDYLASDNAFRVAARGASLPSGYSLAFQDLAAATEQIGYLTYKNIDSGNYDVGACADFCNNEKFCLGFNIYVERDPSLNPADGCPNPTPITNVKCALFGYPVSLNSATNSGQYRSQFQVVVTASNGYSKADPANCPAAPSVADFNAPTSLSGAINAPLTQKNGQDYDTYNGMRLFNENPYDPSLCATACEAQTTYDKAHPDSNGDYKPCNFFNSYILTKNGVPLGTYCSFYTQSWASSYAVNTGYDWEADQYRVVCSASYSLTVTDSGSNSV